MTRQNKKSDKISLIALYLKGRKADLIARSDEVATSYLLQADQPFRILRHGVIECVACVHFLLEVVGELLGHFRIVTGELLVAVLGVDVFCNRDRRLLGVEDKRGLAFGGESRVVAEQSPVAGIHGHLLVLKLAVEIETVVDAVYTDGIVECKDKNGEMLGYDRLKKMISDCWAETPEDYYNNIYKAYTDYIGNASEAGDDLTFVILMCY